MKRSTMLKIEMMHSDALLGPLQELCETHQVRFTTMAVHAACGEVCGFYNDDFTEPRFYSVLLSKPDQGEALIQQLQERFSHDVPFVLVSDVAVLSVD